MQASKRVSPFILRHPKIVRAAATVLGAAVPAATYALGTGAPLKSTLGFIIGAGAVAGFAAIGAGKSFAARTARIQDLEQELARTPEARNLRSKLKEIREERARLMIEIRFAENRMREDRSAEGRSHLAALEHRMTPLRAEEVNLKMRLVGLSELKNIRPIGAGGQASVYRCTASELEGEDVVIKRIDIRGLGEAEIRTYQNRLKREGESLAALAGSYRVAHFLGFKEVVMQEGMPPELVLVEEFIDGEMLSKWKGPLGDAVEIMLEVALALQEAHRQKVVHRDLKPENVMLIKKPADGMSVRVVDWGLAVEKQADVTQLTQEGEIGGTPAFMAPEQLNPKTGLASTGAPADIYALGVIIYWLITGKIPHDEGFHEVNPYNQAAVYGYFMARRVDKSTQAPKLTATGTQLFGKQRAESNPVLESIQRLLDKMLAYEPAGRPHIDSVAKELADILELIKTSNPTSASSSS